MYRFIRLTLVICIAGAVIRNPANARWRPVQNFNSAVDCIAAAESLCYAGGNGVRLARSIDSRWVNVTNNLNGLNFHSFLLLKSPLDSNRTVVFAATDRGVYRSFDDGGNWIADDSGLTRRDISSLAVIDSMLFAGGSDGGVFRSTDYGATWNEKDTLLIKEQIWALAALDTLLFAGSPERGIYRSTDRGEAWAGANGGLTNRRVIALAGVGPNLFAGTQFGGAFFSSNRGLSWSPISHGFPASEFTLVNNFASKDTNIFAATALGVFLFDAFDSTWRDVSDGLDFPDNDILCLAVFQNYLFAGEFYGHVWRRPLSEILLGVNENRRALPEHFALDQNYPNPFNPTTTIRYQLPEAEKVELTICNVWGQEIAVLVNGFQSAGYKEVNYNAGNLGAGVYVCRLTAGKRTEVRKLLLMK